ncbi:hypothetical protein LTR27_010981 [Elasticomyces elasticus]|nr:hypothetical protein LTR27_010981 [Elasticomyces elasticus]
MRLALRAIETRKLKGGLGSHHDLLDLYMSSAERDPELYTPAAIIGLTMTTMQAGAETTAFTTATCMYCLLSNKRVLEKLRLEIESVAPATESGWELPPMSVLRKLTYLEACVKESQRLRPTINIVSERIVPAAGATIAGVDLPGGTIVGMNTGGIYHDPSIFGWDVDVYRPERWLEASEEQRAIMNRGNLSFLAGKRMCLGLHVAWMEMRKVVSALVMNFDMELAHPERGLKQSAGIFAAPTDVQMAIPQPHRSRESSLPIRDSGLAEPITHTQKSACKQIAVSPWRATETGCGRSPRRWTLLFLCLASGAVAVNMLAQYFFPTVLGHICHVLALFSVTIRLDNSLWQSKVPDNAAHWLGEHRNALSTMQVNYWNGSDWPTSIQWVSAFMDTLLVASDRSFAYTLDKSDAAAHSGRSLRTEIDHYLSHVEAFYDDEDVIQIFDAAYDDAQWVVLEWLEAIRFIGEYPKYAQSSHGRANIARFAHRAHIFYNIVQDQFNTSECGGGITWNPALATYKNAITNELFLSSSIAMYLYYPGDTLSDPYPSPRYANVTNTTMPALPRLARHDPILLRNAVDEYQWFKTHNFTNALGLVVDGFHISHNQTTCNERNEQVYTYNQGVMLSGLRGLWEATGDTSYLHDGYKYIKATINATGWNVHSRSLGGRWAGLGRNGIMEDYCDAPANCSQDNQIFKGIYFHHLGLFCEPLPTKQPLVAGVTYTAPFGVDATHSRNCASYIPWIVHNARAALDTRNTTNIMGGWWGASFLNKTQEPWLAWSPPKPKGSVDPINEPWLLRQPPWTRQDQRGVLASGRDISRSFSNAVDSSKRHRTSLLSRDINNKGRGRTVETQASGMGVVKATSDFMHRVRV